MALLPVIGDIFYLIFFIIPDKNTGIDFGILKPGKDFNSFV